MVVRPKQHLETFGATTIYYHLVCELMDNPGQVRVREGNIHAYRPTILTPHTCRKHAGRIRGGPGPGLLDGLKPHEKELLFCNMDSK